MSMLMVLVPSITSSHMALVALELRDRFHWVALITWQVKGRRIFTFEIPNHPRYKLTFVIMSRKAIEASRGQFPYA